MEAENLFPVFSQLHRGESQEPPICQPTKRPSCPNEAGLFLVTTESAKQADESEEEIEMQPLKVSGDVFRDTVAMLHCLAYLTECFGALDSNDLRRIADEIRVRS
jgi:hypothetical protein